MTIAADRIEKANALKNKRAYDKGVSDTLEKVEHAYDHMSVGKTINGVSIPSHVMRQICKDIAQHVSGLKFPNKPIIPNKDAEFNV